MFPANGIINPQHQQDSNVYDLSLKIETTSNAHVISPIDANVVFTGFIPNFGQVIILKQDDFFCVLTGLGLINCFLGDTLSAGEPIGRMPASEDKSETSFKLRLELHKGGQHLDPRPYLAA